MGAYLATRIHGHSGRYETSVLNLNIPGNNRAGVNDLCKPDARIRLAYCLSDPPSYCIVANPQDDRGIREPIQKRRHIRVIAEYRGLVHQFAGRMCRIDEAKNSPTTATGCVQYDPGMA